MKDVRVYLAHIMECIERIELYTRDGREAFLANPMAQDAVIRNLEVIGEAAKRVGEDFRSLHSEIPWRGMSALRDVLIPDYEGVDTSQVWAVVGSELPALKIALQRSLPPLEQLEAELAGETESAAEEITSRSPTRPKNPLKID